MIPISSKVLWPYVGHPIMGGHDIRQHLVQARHSNGHLIRLGLRGQRLHRIVQQSATEGVPQPQPLDTLFEAGMVIGDFKHEHSHRHSALNYQTPAEYAAACRHTHTPWPGHSSAGQPPLDQRSVRTSLPTTRERLSSKRFQPPPNTSCRALKLKRRTFECVRPTPIGAVSTWR
jgi:hypothetical protein